MQPAKVHVGSAGQQRRERKTGRDCRNALPVRVALARTTPIVRFFLSSLRASGPRVRQNFTARRFLRIVACTVASLGLTRAAHPIRIFLPPLRASRSSLSFFPHRTSESEREREPGSLLRVSVVAIDLGGLGLGLFLSSNPFFFPSQPTPGSGSLSCLALVCVCSPYFFFPAFSRAFLSAFNPPSPLFFFFFPSHSTKCVSQLQDTPLHSLRPTIPQLLAVPFAATGANLVRAQAQG